MIVISHRGYWQNVSEKNTAIAFERSFSLGFGTETDLRDFGGVLVISHDIPNNNFLVAEDFLKLYVKSSISEPLALNIKSDGLQYILLDLLKKYSIENYFVFDMSVPEQIQYIRHGFKTFTRQSEYELTPVLYEKSCGVWIDCFDKDWIDEHVIEEHFRNGKMVALVSPDLHKRDPKNFWERLSKMKIIDDDRLILCTDLPEDARRFFHGKD